MRKRLNLVNSVFFLLNRNSEILWPLLNSGNCDFWVSVIECNERSGAMELVLNDINIRVKYKISQYTNFFILNQGI